MCALGTLLALAPVAVAGPSPGGRYDGASASGPPIMLRVARDGSRVTDYVFQTRMPCSDGKTRNQGILPKGEGPVVIDANGAFAYTSTSKRSTHRTKRGAVRGAFALTVSGAFSPAGDVVTGTVDTTFKSKRFDCASGPVAFTAHLNGTPGAPWRDATLATGTYTAKSKRFELTARVLAPGKMLVRANMVWQMRCENGKWVEERHFYAGFSLSEGRMSDGGTVTDRVGPREQYRVTSRTRLTLRFTGGAAYTVSGRWRGTSIWRRDGALYAVCRYDRRFTGAFVSGPG